MQKSKGDVNKYCYYLWKYEKKITHFVTVITQIRTFSLNLSTSIKNLQTTKYSLKWECFRKYFWNFLEKHCVLKLHNLMLVTVTNVQYFLKTLSQDLWPLNLTWYWLLEGCSERKRLSHDRLLILTSFINFLTWVRFSNVSLSKENICVILIRPKIYCYCFFC